MSKSRKISAGNILIILSFLILTVAFYPFIKLSFSSQAAIPKITAQSEEINEFTISIPKIEASAQVIPDVDPQNPQEYKQALEKGVAHAKGTALPGEGKTSFLFAHSTTDLWELTSLNTPFFKLGNIENSDEIIIKRNDKEYHYIVFDKKEVWPEDTKYLKEDQGNILILQTCTPIGTNIKRLLVFAKPVQF